MWNWWGGLWTRSGEIGDVVWDGYVREVLGSGVKVGGSFEECGKIMHTCAWILGGGRNYIDQLE